MRIKIESITVEGKELWQVEMFRDGRKEPYDRLEIDSKFLLVDLPGEQLFCQRPCKESRLITVRSVKVYSLDNYPFVITGKEEEE